MDGRSCVCWLLYMTAVAGSIHRSRALLSCSSETERIVSYNETLIPSSSIMASSQDTVFNPDDNLFNRNNIPLRLWCTESFEEAMREESDEGMNLSNMSAPIFYINVTFSESLLITHIVTSGFSNGYVNNFSIEYRLEDEQPLISYNYSDTMVEFISQQIDSVFTLSKPLAAKYLHLNIHDGLMTPSGRLCWHLTLMGCTLQEAISPVNDDVDEPSPITTNSPTCLPTTHPTTTTTTTTTTTATSEISVPELLLIVLPTAVTTLLLIACIMTISICICWNCRPTKLREASPASTSSTDTLGMVDNEIYKSRSSIFPMTIHCVDTMATVKDNGINTDSNEATYENYTSDAFPSYKESGFYESISSKYPEVEQSTKSVDSMVDNPNYNVPYLKQHGHCRSINIALPNIPPLQAVSSLVGTSSISMVDNECYKVPVSVKQKNKHKKEMDDYPNSNAHHELYETPN